MTDTALRPFIRHDRECVWSGYGLDDLSAGEMEHCTCGLRAALAAASPPPLDDYETRLAARLCEVQHAYHPATDSGPCHLCRDLAAKVAASPPPLAKPVLTDAALADAIASVMHEQGYDGPMDGPRKMASAILDRIKRDAASPPIDPGGDDAWWERPKHTREERGDLTDEERAIVGEPGDLVSEDPVPPRSERT